MEELYNQKQILREEIQKSETNLNELKSSTYPMPKSENYKFNLNTISAYENRPIQLIEEDIKHLASNSKQEALKVESKPPIPQKVNTVSFQSNLDEKEYKSYESISDDLKRIEKIWQEFQIDDDTASRKSYDFNLKFEKRVKKANKHQLRRPASVQVEWVPRVTIPQPFSMTIREQIKSEKRKN